MPFMRSILAVFLLLSICRPVFAETTYHRCTTFYAANKEWLECGIDLMYLCYLDEVPEYEFPFPDIVDPEKPIFGGTLTDGNHYYGVLVLTLKDEENPDRIRQIFDEKKVNAVSLMEEVQLYDQWNEKNNELIQAAEEKIQQDEQLREQILSNPCFAQFFPDQKIKILPGMSIMGKISIVSENFPESYWHALIPLEGFCSHIGRRYSVALVQENPENKLYPTLPPETEEEGMFLQNLRETYENRDSDTESLVYGIATEEPGIWSITMEQTAEPGSTLADYYQNYPSGAPFALGGFYNEDSSPQVALRLDPNNPLIGNPQLALQMGVLLLPPEQREDERCYSLQASFFLESDRAPWEISDQEKIVVEEDNVAVCTYRQYPDVPEEEGVASTETLDRLNMELGEKFRPLARQISSALNQWKTGKPMDIATTQEDDLIFIACTRQDADIEWDFSSLSEIQEVMQNILDATPSRGREKSGTLGEKFLDFEVTSNTGIWDDMSFSEVYLTFFFGKFHIVTGKHPDILCAVIETVDENQDNNDHTIHFSKMTALLKEKVELSRTLAKEKCPVPKTICQWQGTEEHVILKNETTPGCSTYTLRVHSYDIPQILAFTRTFFPSFLP